MKTIKIAAEKEYEILFDHGWKSALAEISAAHDKTLIIAPRALIDLFNISSFASANIKVVSVPIGEAAKSVKVLAEMWDACAEFGLTRSDCIIGFGGGSTTDLAGVCCCYLAAWHHLACDSNFTRRNGRCFDRR